MSGFPKAAADKADANKPPVTDANVGTLTLLTDAITAIGTLQTKVNTILSRLRDARVIQP